MRRTLTILGTSLLLAACGSEEPTEPAPSPAPSTAASAPAPPAAHPTTEEGLIQAFTDASQARDLAALTRLVGPELGADLARMHSQDEGAFWGRAQRWVEHASHGVSVTYRQEPDAEGRWRALVTFGDGVEERVVFARVEGKLVFSEL